MLNPLNVFLWGAGVLWLLFHRSLGFLGVFYLLFLALMMALHAKDYYLAPAYPVFFAAGAIALTAGTRSAHLRTGVIGAYALLLAVSFFLFVPFSIPVLPPQQFLGHERALHFAPKDSENHAATLLPQFYADRFGWEEMVGQIAGVYNALPEADKRQVGILCDNYGEAGAVDILGRRYGLPYAISGHQNYLLWGPRGHTGSVMIILRRSPEDMPQNFETVEDKGLIDNKYAMPSERKHIYLCHGLKENLADRWYREKDYY